MIPHAVTSVNPETGSPDTYSYDANGNMTCRIENGVTYSQTYNAENRISSIAKRTGDCATGTILESWSFAYDGDGTRVSTAHFTGTSGTPDSTTSYFMGGQFEVKDGSTKKYYSIAGMMVAVNDGTGLQYLLTDHLGSTVAVTNSSGTLTSQQRYLPFGAPRTIPNSPIAGTDFTYTGQRKLDDGMGGVMDYRARFYSSALGRFLQPDSVVAGDRRQWAQTVNDVANSMFAPLTTNYSNQKILDKQNRDNAFIQSHNGSLLNVSNNEKKKAKITGITLDPQAFNRYTYVRNNPIRHVDPTGYDDSDCGGVPGFSYCYYLDGTIISLEWGGITLIFDLTQYDPQNREDKKVLYHIDKFVRNADNFKLESENLVKNAVVAGLASIATIAGLALCIETGGWGCVIALVAFAEVILKARDFKNSVDRRNDAIKAGEGSFMFLLNVRNPK